MVKTLITSFIMLFGFILFGIFSSYNYRSDNGINREKPIKHELLLGNWKLGDMRVNFIDSNLVNIIDGCDSLLLNCRYEIGSGAEIFITNGEIDLQWIPIILVDKIFVFQTDEDTILLLKQ